MADSKAQDLVKRALIDLASITGVRLWSGKTGELNALGVELSELLTSAIVTDGAIDYKALTAKGFWDSIMTESRRGVGTYATDSEIEGKTTDALIRAGKQDIMQAQWYKDWGVANSVPGLYQRNAETWGGTKSAIWQAVWSGGMVASTTIELMPDDYDSAKDFKSCYCVGNLVVNNASSYGFSLTQIATGSNVIKQIQDSGIYINFNGWRVFGIYSFSGWASVDISMTVHMNLKP